MPVITPGLRSTVPGGPRTVASACLVRPLRLQIREEQEKTVGFIDYGIHYFTYTQGTLENALNHREVSRHHGTSTQLASIVLEELESAEI